MPAIGPQNLNSGKSPWLRRRSRPSLGGVVYTSGSLPPSARYAGRGVIVTPAVVAMLNHQNSTALRASTSSQMRRAWISRLDWRQNQTSLRSRKYQPLATMPCSLGSLPVSIVAWQVEVTAGSGGVSGAGGPNCFSRGACSSSAGVSPTTLSTRTLATP